MSSLNSCNRELSIVVVVYFYKTLSNSASSFIVKCVNLKFYIIPPSHVTRTYQFQFVRNYLYH